MGNRVFVGNLAYSVSTAELKEEFARIGQVTDARVLTDRESGQSRGFGFVTFATDAEAQLAIDTMNGANFAGRSLIVNEARERENRGENRGPSGSRFQGGGNGGNANSGGGGQPRNFGPPRGNDRGRRPRRDRGGDFEDQG